MPAGLLKSCRTFFKSKCLAALKSPLRVTAGSLGSPPFEFEAANMRLSQGFDFGSELESDSVADS